MGSRRRMMGSVSPYTRLSYIESDGTTGSHINTQVSSYTNTNFEIKFMPSSPFGTTHHVMIGCSRETSTGNLSIDTYTAADATSNGRIYTGSQFIEGHLTSGDNIVKLNGTTCTINGTDYTVIRSTFTYNYKIYLFAELHQSSTRYRCAGRIYYVKIWRGSTLVGDFIPVLKNDTGEYGFLNLVDDTFHTNTNLSGG